MDIRNRGALKEAAANALGIARQQKKIILIYTAIVTLATLLVTVGNLLLNQQIEGTGGLSNLGTRSILTTVQMVLPMAQTIVLLCLDFGYLSAMLRIGRKQYADHTDLLTGFHRFGPLLRLTLLQSLIYLGIMLVSSYISTMIFMVTPLSTPFWEITLPLVEDSSMLTESMLDTETVMAMYDAMAPMMVIMALVFAALSLPVSYRYRMANYCLLDHPQAGAFAAMRCSRMMMRGNILSLFKLDLSFWWYYLLTGLATAVCYGDVILAALGFTLPLPEMASYFLFYGIYLAIQFGIYYWLRNRVEVTYVMAYESLRPKEIDNGTVLGNIFNM